MQLLGSKNTAVWLRSDERVADDLKKALMKRSDRRPVVWMSKEVTYAPLLIMHQVWHGLVPSSVRQYTAAPQYYAEGLNALEQGTKVANPAGPHRLPKPEPCDSTTRRS